MDIGSTIIAGVIATIIALAIWAILGRCFDMLRTQHIGVWFLAFPYVFELYYRIRVAWHPEPTLTEKAGWMDFSDEAVERSKVILKSHEWLTKLQDEVKRKRAERKLLIWRSLGYIVYVIPIRLLWKARLTASAWDCLRVMWPIVKHRQPWHPMFTVGFSVFDVPEGERLRVAYGALHCFKIPSHYQEACIELGRRGYLDLWTACDRLYVRLTSKGERFVYMSGALMGGYKRGTGEEHFRISEQEQSYLTIVKYQD